MLNPDKGCFEHPRMFLFAMQATTQHAHYLQKHLSHPFFFSALSHSHPQLIEEIQNLYVQAGQWGNANEAYYHQLHSLFYKLSEQYSIPKRIPPVHYRDILDETDRVIVILEQLDYLLKLKGEKSPYGYGAYSISQLKKPLTEFKGRLRQLKGIGPVTERIVQEILKTGTSSYFESLMQHC